MPRSLMNLDQRLADMDRVGVDMQALSIAPDLYFYNIETEPAVELCRAQNEAIAGVVQEHPDRFVGLATIPLQSVDLAIDELERAVGELGLRGIQIGTNVNGKNLDEKEFWPFYQTVQKLGIPIMLHPISAAAAGADRLRRYSLGNFIGIPFESAIAGSSIIFGGVLKDFPQLKFFLVHAGGFLPYQRGRLEHGYSMRKEPKVIIDHPPSKYYRLLYFDTVAHDQKTLAYLIDSTGSDRILLGSDHPFDMADPDPVKHVKQLTTISEEDRERILGRNAAELFKLN